MATFELTGKTVLLTGATDGLGRALAADLAGRGSTLLLHGRDEDRGSITLTECRAPRWMRTKTTGWVSTAVRGAGSGSRAWWSRWRCDRHVVAAIGGPGRMAAVVDTMSRDLAAPCPGTAVVDQPAGPEVNSLPPVIRLISCQPRSAASAPPGSASRSPRCT